MGACWVYILTNKPGATLYVGVTNDLIRRACEHREGLVKGFTQRYGLKMLVHFEKYDAPTAAIQREKNIKHWPRLWKLQLVESGNPQWRDIHHDISLTDCRVKPGNDGGNGPRIPLSSAPKAPPNATKPQWFLPVSRI